MKSVLCFCCCLNTKLCLTVGRVKVLLGAQGDFAGPHIPTALGLVLGDTGDPCAAGPSGDVAMGCSWQPGLGRELQALALPAAAACRSSGRVIS